MACHFSHEWVNGVMAMFWDAPRKQSNFTGMGLMACLYSHEWVNGVVTMLWEAPRKQNNSIGMGLVAVNIAMNRLKVSQYSQVCFEIQALYNWHVAIPVTMV